MNITLWEYYVAAAVCAAAGAFLGSVSRNRRRAFQSAAWCVVIVATAAVLELFWHETPRVQPLERPLLVLAMSIALAIPTVVGFVSAYAAARSGWNVSARIGMTIAVLLALAPYPVYTLYLVCYVGHDCI